MSLDRARTIKAHPLFSPSHTDNLSPDIRELLACQPLAIMRITQDMHDADTHSAHHDFALDGQRLYHLVALDVALHGHDRRYRLKLLQDRKYRKVSGVDNQLHAVKMLPDDLRQLLEMRNMRI